MGGEGGGGGAGLHNHSDGIPYWVNPYGALIRKTSARRMGLPSKGYRMGIPMASSYSGYRMGIPGSIPVEDAHTASYIKLSYAGPSQHELPSRVQFLLISKAFIALNVFIPKFNYFILFCVFFFMVFLKILTLFIR